MFRLFVGIPMPERVRQRLTLMSQGIQNAHWVRPDGLHLTLRFIGEVDRYAMDDIDSALMAVSGPAFSITLQGVDVFHAGKGKRPNALWTGVTRNPDLEALRDRIERAVVRAGLPPEGRKFLPHVTLARLRDAPEKHLGAFIAGNNLFRSEPIAVSSFSMFSSHPSGEGQIYIEEVQYPLG